MKPGGGGGGDFRFPHRLSLCLSVCQSTRCLSTRFSELFSVVLWDIDLKFGMWISLGIVQNKFEFRYAWLTFTGVIVLCWNLVFRVFFCLLLRYWLEIWYMNLSWYNTDQVRVSSRLTYFYRSYCPLLKFSFPEFLCCLLKYWLEMWYMNLAWHNTDYYKEEFRNAWPTFTGVIALCWNLVFPTFLCRLWRYSLEIWYMNLPWHNADKV